MRKDRSKKKISLIWRVYGRIKFPKPPSKNNSNSALLEPCDVLSFFFFSFESASPDHVSPTLDTTPLKEKLSLFCVFFSTNKTAESYSYSQDWPRILFSFEFSFSLERNGDGTFQRNGVPCSLWCPFCVFEFCVWD